MKKTIIIHPFLFAIFPILFLYSYNTGQMLVSEIFIPAVITVSITFFLWVSLGYKFKDYKKSGLLVSLFLLLFFSYGHLYLLIRDLTVGGLNIGRHRYLLFTWGLFFITGTYFIMKMRRILHGFTTVLNIMSFSLVVASLINTEIYGMKAGYALRDNRKSTNVEAAMIELKSRSTLPDIYYIILDGYASSSAMEEIFNFDNHEFISYLTDRGFYVASESQCNYAPTFPSLASTLNMTYLEGISLEEDRVFAEMIENNKVIQSLKALGYKYVHFPSTNAELAHNINADIVYDRDYYGGEFSSVLFETTMLKVFSALMCSHIRSHVLFAFEKLAEVPDIKAPTFTFVDVGIPHPPYVFGRNGERYIQEIPSLLATIWEPKERYLEQLIFVNKKVEALIDEILSKSENPPIIILQADHGPLFAYKNFEYDPRILNAYYLPGVEKSMLYRSISPVNSFRLIFNLYFGTEFKLLEDKIYVREKA